MYIIFFDDPFYLRFDAIVFILYSILLGMSFLGGAYSNAYNGISPVLSYALSHLFSGGMALIIDLILSAVYCRTGNIQEKQLEDKLQDVHYYEMMMEFAVKENSLENLLLYDQLEKLKKKAADNNGRLSRTDLDDIQSKFMKPLSRHEINFSGDTKRKFAELQKKASNNQDLTFEELRECLYIELMLNIGDTANRVAKTQEHRKWIIAHDLSKIEGNV